MRKYKLIKTRTVKRDQSRYTYVILKRVVYIDRGFYWINQTTKRNYGKQEDISVFKIAIILGKCRRQIWELCSSFSYYGNVAVMPFLLCVRNYFFLFNGVNVSLLSQLYSILDDKRVCFSYYNQFSIKYVVAFK